MTASGTEDMKTEEIACSNYINRSTPMPRVARMPSAGGVATVAYLKDGRRKDNCLDGQSKINKKSSKARK